MRMRLPIEFFLVTYTDAPWGNASAEQRVDLLPYLQEWVPAVSPLKNGGEYLAGAYLDGRQLAMAAYDNALEALNLSLWAQTPEDVIALAREIRSYLARGRSYFLASYQDKPVFLQVRARRETVRRYAVLANGSAPQDENYFAEPADSSQLPAFEGWPLELERGHWLSNKPGDETATECYGYWSLGTPTFGNVTPAGVFLPETDGTVFLSNKVSDKNLTHIFTFDTSLGAWSANLVGAAPPYNLLPSPVGVGDIVYFICQDAGAVPHPFDNLAFNLATANGTTGVWEYYNAAWVTLVDRRDNTAFMTTLGVSTLHWRPQSDWAALAVNGITGLSVRYRVTAVGTGVVPRQQTQNVYTCMWNYTVVDGAAIGGDLPATLRAILENSADNGYADPNYLFAHRVIVGLRSVGRGEDFHSFINLNNSAYTTILGANSSYVNDVLAAAGRRVRYNPVATGTETVVSVLFLAGVDSANYRGRFRAFLRAQQTAGSPSDILLRLELIDGNRLSDPNWSSEWVPFLNNDPWQLVEFGEIAIGADNYDLNNEISYETYLRISARVNNAAPDIYLYDLILIPTDEWSAEFVAPTMDVYTSLGRDDTYGTRRLDIDSVINLKRPIRARLTTAQASMQRWASWEAIAAGPAILQAGADQRLYFLASRFADSADPTDQRSEPYLGFKIQLSRTQRYFAARGGS